MKLYSGFTDGSTGVSTRDGPLSWSRLVSLTDPQFDKDMRSKVCNICFVAKLFHSSKTGFILDRHVMTHP